MYKRRRQQSTFSQSSTQSRQVRFRSNSVQRNIRPAQRSLFLDEEASSLRDEVEDDVEEEEADEEKPQRVSPYSGS